MATTGTKTALAPDVTVTITNGVANPSSVNILAEGVVQFNADVSDYLLQFFDRYNDRHVPTNVYLPANGSVTVVGGKESEDHNATSSYNVLFYTAEASTGETAATGGNKIIIGSGADEKA
jgi:hypothetical protein